MVSSVEAVASVISVVGWGSMGAEVSSGAAVSGTGGSVVGASVTGASVSTSTASVAAWVSSISSANTGVTS